MDKIDWDVPRTEAGLQQVLRQLEECRAAGDHTETGNGLLSLSHLVKWVRSDTDQAPFPRSHELVLEALEAFRRADNKRGRVRALVAASAMAAPPDRASMLSEAESLAEGPGDEDLIASIVAANARALGMSDRKQAAVLQKRALEIYRRTGNQRGQAHCLFSLSIHSDAPEDCRSYAVEGAALHRGFSDPDGAARCMTIALMKAEKLPIAEWEALAREGLQDALDSGNRGHEGYFYRKLAIISTSKGELEEAEKYRRWAETLQEADGFTPLERWESDIQMAKMMVAMAKTQGNKDAEKLFRDELKRLRASKPAS